MSAQPLQLDFWMSEDACEMRQLRQDVDKYRISSDKVRRGVFSRVNEIGANIEDVSRRLEIIERFICRPDDD